MSAATKIEWTHGDDGTVGATWNPVTGCVKVSVDILVFLIDDPDVNGHAVEAVGKVKAPAARTALQAKLDDKPAWVRGTPPLPG